MIKTDDPCLMRTRGIKPYQKKKVFGNDHFRVKIKYTIIFKVKVYLIRFFNEFQEFLGIY
jgi:hypothetical protein